MPPIPPLGQHTLVGGGGLRIEVIGEKELQRKLQEYGHIAIPKATARALNSTVVTVRKETIKVVAKRMGLKQKDVRDKSKIRRADKRRLEAVIRFEGKALNMIRFKARETSKGVTAAPWGRRRLFRSAFIAKMPNGAVVVMTRDIHSAKYNPQSKERPHLPIRPILGPGIAKTANDPELAKERERRIRELLPTRLQRELEFQLQRIARGGR